MAKRGWIWCGCRPNPIKHAEWKCRQNHEVVVVCQVCRTCQKMAPGVETAVRQDQACVEEETKAVVWSRAAQSPRFSTNGLCLWCVTPRW